MASASTTRSEDPSPSERWYRPKASDSLLHSAYLPGPNPSVQDYRLAQQATLLGALQRASRDLGLEGTKVLIQQFLNRSPDDQLASPDLSKVRPNELLELLLDSDQWMKARGPVPTEPMVELDPMEIGMIEEMDLGQMLDLVSAQAAEA